MCLSSVSFVCEPEPVCDQSGYGYQQDVIPSKAYTKYTINVKTSGQSDSGTDALVTIQLFGTQGETPPQNYRGTKFDGEDPFEEGQEDVFILELPYIGNVHTIR